MNFVNILLLQITYVSGAVGRCYQYGRGVARSVAVAEQYYKLAADQGCPRAAKKLSKLSVSQLDHSVVCVSSIVLTVQ